MGAETRRRPKSGTHIVTIDAHVVKPWEFVENRIGDHWVEGRYPKSEAKSLDSHLIAKGGMEEMAPKLKRRDFLKAMTAATGGALLASCAPQVVKETVIVEKPVEKVVKETVVVEKKETVIVEKSVEKVITATPSPRTVLRFQTWTDPGLAAMEHMLGVFSEEHPGIEVEVEPPGPGWPE